MAAAIPLVTLAATAGAGLITAAGAAQQSRAQEEAARYQAAVAKNQAAYEIQKGQIEESQARAKTSALVSRQRAIQGASGIDVNTGSHAAVRAGTVAAGLTDAAMIRANAKARAMAALDQSTLSSMEASNAATAGGYAVAGSLLGTASSVGSRWSAYKNAGVSLNPGWF